MSEEKSFFLALKVFASDIGSAFSDLFRSLPFRRNEKLDKIFSNLNLLGERLERIEKKLDTMGEITSPSHDGTHQSPSEKASFHEKDFEPNKGEIDRTTLKTPLIQSVKEKMDGIKVKNAEWISETKELFAHDKDKEWTYKASELFTDLDHDPEPVFPNPDEDPYSNYFKEIKNKQCERMKKRVAYLKGEDRLERMEEIKLMIEITESFIEKKQQEVDALEKNCQIYEANLAKLKEDPYAKHSLGSRANPTNNIKRQILSLENKIDIVNYEISSAKVSIECKQEKVEDLEEELLLLETQIEKEEKEKRAAILDTEKS